LVNDFTSKYSRVTLEALHHELNTKPKQVQTTLYSEESETSEINDALSQSIFLQTWFVPRQRAEMRYYLKQIESQEDNEVRNLMKIILSRAARSCRATTHSDLATLQEPQFGPYYCRKHYKICRPVTTIIPHLRRYTKDTIKRLKTFSGLKQEVFAEIINADSSAVDIFSSIKASNPSFFRILEKQKIAGVFTSPPYVGQIDYHEQHAYAYELFQIKRRDEFEIGRKKNGVSKKAQDDYVKGISGVLSNVARFLKDDAHVFIVANDQRNLYPEIASQSGFAVIDTFRRPVLNRTERDKQPYAESIFHMMKE
jgi:DNA modification methylase